MLSTRSRFASVVVAAILFLAAVGSAAQSDRIRGSVETIRSVRLKGNIHPKAIAANDRGPLEASTRINGVTLVLAQSDQQMADLEQFLESQRDPASSDFQNWLTPEQYGERFGVSENDLAKLASWLQSRGFAVEQVARARNWITFSGTAGQMARAFRTEIHQFETDGESHFANAAEPWIPASLDGIVGEIRGLDDFRPKPNARIRLTPELNSVNGSHYLAPGDLATVYNISGLYDAGYDGTGQKIVIAGQTDVDIGDIKAFRAQFNLPVKDPQLVLVGTDPGVSADDQIEANLDLEWSGAVARNATIIYVYSHNVFASVQYAIDQNLAPVISLSYGGCETAGSASFRTVAQQANAQGITWMNSSGDSGAAGCDYTGQVATHGLAAVFPADIPEVTAVGGTEFNEGSGAYWSTTNGANYTSAVSYIPEKAWNDTGSGARLSSGGGGVSVIFPKPWWQTGPGVPDDHARDIPDVSLAASGTHDGYVIYANGGLLSVGGTSASSPAFAGIVSILNQYLVTRGVLPKPGLGNINPTLYSLAQTTTDVFHDITVGNTNVPCTAGSKDCVNGFLGYAALPGYDLATGLGSVDAYSLITRWTSLAPAAIGTTIRLDTNPGTISPNATALLTATVTAVTGVNTPTGSVTFTSGGTVLGSAVLTGSGVSATATFALKGSTLSSGANVITGSYTPAGNFGSSTGTATVNTTPLIGTSTDLAASPAIVADGAATILTATVKPANGTTRPAGTVSFNLGSTTLGSAVLAAASSGTGSTATLSVKGTSLAAGVNSITVSYPVNGSFGGSTGSVSVTRTVTPVGTTISASASPASIGATGTTQITATVKPVSGSNTPDGSVVFAIGSTRLGTATLSGSGGAATAALTVAGSSLGIGSNNIIATYGGSSSLNSSTAPPVTVTVTPPPVSTAMTIAASPASIAQSASTVVTVTLKAATGSVAPGGNITFALGDSNLGTAALSASGLTATAALTLKGTALAAGSNSITGSYTGSSGFASSSAKVTVTMIAPPVGTSVVLSANPPSITQSTSTQITATVKSATGSIGPAGSVTFALGKTTLGSAAVAVSGAAGTAVLAIKGNSLQLGNNTITATYTPAGNFTGSTSSITLAVATDRVSTTTSVKTSASNMTQAAITQLTVTVRPATGSVAPSGIVVITLGNVVLGSSTLTTSGGAATATLSMKGSSLKIGTNAITANYVTAGNFANSTGSTTITVSPASTASRTI